MPTLRTIADGLRSLFRKQRVDTELDEELRSFLEMAAEKKMKQGASREEALRAVRLEHGNLEAAKEVVRDARSPFWKRAGGTCDSLFARCASLRASRPSLYSPCRWALVRTPRFSHSLLRSC